MNSYEACAAAAARLLLCQQIRALPLDLFHLEHPGRTILLDSVQNYQRLTGRQLQLSVLQDGCTMLPGGVPGCSLILYWAGGCGGYTRQRFTIAHELGHLYLGHRTDGPAEEREANWFAGQLLMPDCVLREMRRLQGHLLPAEVESWFEVSYAAARTRLEQLAHNPCFLPQLDRQLLARYRPFLLQALQDPYLISI